MALQRWSCSQFPDSAENMQNWQRLHICSNDDHLGQHGVSPCWIYESLYSAEHHFDFFDSSSLCISTAGAGIKHTESIIFSALFLWLLHSFLLIPSVVHTKCIMKQHDNYNDYGRKGGLFSFTIHIRYIPHSFEIENYRAPPPPRMFMLFLHSVKSCFLNGNKLA